MTTFMLDLWHDLREKRLWPVAVGLLAAIAAIPIVLFKPVDDAPPAPAPTTDTAARETLPVVSVESGPTSGSNLATFDEKNPFKPMKDLKKENEAAAADDGAGSAGGTSVAGGSDGGSSAGSGGSSGGSTGSTGGSPSTGGGSTPPGVDPSGPRVQWFRYTADFEFGEPGKEAKFEAASTFTLLPDENAPAVVFMGVSDDHKHAAFFIADEGFEADGEGKCDKSGSCRFVTLSLKDTGDEMTFSSRDGQLTYNLKLLDIDRKNLSTGDSTSDTSGDPAEKRGKGLAATGEGVAGAVTGAGSLVPADDVPSGSVARKSE
jgi:hypothetical protein